MINSLYNKLKDALEELLREKHPLIEPSPKDANPLFLICRLKSDVIGFSALDDKPENNFSKAFQNFKNLYSLYSNVWADFDLTLVLCKTNIKEVSDEFCNEIEINSYFCRKFVIDLNRDLKVELGRLPFIPLSAESIIELKRPISAQTFLMKHGVVSNLARYLVVPHARGIEKIINECIEGNLGKPKWNKTEIEEFHIPAYEVSPKVRLKTLEISSFRAYRESFEFDLDADLVVLFGPNGFGKTSFFDAIDFICTGGVSRFDERFRQKTDKLLKVLKHLDSSVDNSFVKAKISIDEKEILFERYVKNFTKAYIKGLARDRTDTLIELAGLLKRPPDLRIDNFVRLFRATHIFAQEYQVLTPENFKKDSKLPQDTVSRMLAFQDYVEAINKTSKLSKELERQIKEIKSEINFVENSLKAKRIELEGISKSSKIVENPEAIYDMGKQIVEKINREINIPFVISKEFNKEIVQNWRTKIAAQISSVIQKLELIEKLEIQFPEYRSKRKKTKEKLLEQSQKSKLLDELNEDYSKKKNKLKEYDENIHKMYLEERNLLSKKNSLNWLLQTKDEYEKHKKQILEEDKRYRDINKQLFELKQRIENLQSEKKVAEETKSKILLEIKSVENNVGELSDFEKVVDDWPKLIDRQKKLKVYLIETGQELVNIKNKLRINKNELNNAVIAQDKLREHLENLQQSQAELKNLLDNIERHIMNSICPVCGTVHASKEMLIEKLSIQRGIQPEEIRESLKLYQDEKDKEDEIRMRGRDLELKYNQLEQFVEETKKEYIDIEAKIKSYEEKANLLNITISPEKLISNIDSKKKEALRQMNIKKQQQLEQKSRIEELQNEFQILMKRRESYEQNIRNIENKQSQLRLLINKISSDASNQLVSLEMNNEIIKSELNTITNLIEDLRKKITIRQAEDQRLQKDADIILEKKSTIEREIQELIKGISESKKYIIEVENLIRKLDFGKDMEMNQILHHKNYSEKKLSQLEALQNEITDFEIALDAVQLSATITKIQQDLKKMEKQFQKMEGGRNSLTYWQSYFSVINEELEFLQNRALKEYTEKYGPLASTIQRRMRSVYGFGDLRLYPEKGGIAVQVERKGVKNIAPSDFYSESQIQIVMLSLFLSAALTQTWSSFKPILLDDPVKHFDDLNAYSLLDLIKGLINEPGKKYQFIISTCEDRLFRLMRQKFNRMNGKAIFYIFESIGEKGPKIKRL